METMLKHTKVTTISLNTENMLTFITQFNITCILLTECMFMNEYMIEYLYNSSSIVYNTDKIINHVQMINTLYYNKSKIR